jgi:hypothetical protein
MEPWQGDAVAAGLDPDALSIVAELVARGSLDLDGPPLEESPGFWVIPGFVPYDGHTILTVAHRTQVRGRTDTACELTAILGRAVADATAHRPPGVVPARRRRPSPSPTPV